MEVIKIAVIEDERTAAENLEKMILDYGRQRSVSFGVAIFSSAEDFLSGYTPRFDLIFMDIELPGMNGMHAAEKLRTLDKDVLLIFVTNMRQYVLRGYDVNALNYILKPVKTYSLFMTMDRAMRLLTEKSGGSLLIKTDKATERLSAKEIYYIDVRDHYVVFHCVSGNIQVYSTLKNYAPALLSLGFLRCSSSAILNPRHVKRFDNTEVIMTNGDTVALSRSQKTAFKSEITAYFGEVL
ncbi:MAG: response regulator transcription factor [Lachnospiraceae bacterium]|nr:response regulator transcription factor [Lachnospiraceae bacterium]